MRYFELKRSSTTPPAWRLLLLPILLIASQPAAAAQRNATSAAERSLVTIIQRTQGDSVALLERAVNIDSGTMNFAGIREVAEVFRPRFEALGFTTRWLDGAAFGRAGHLIAERAGRGPHILLIGHLDTVFDRTGQRFERIDPNIVRGPGTADMKGGVVVALAALDALQSIDALDDLKLTVILHGDEESAGAPLTLARKAIIDAAMAADVAIGLENAADDPSTAVTARRSSSRWTIKVTAKSAHSSQIFTDTAGAGAIYELARILSSFYSDLRSNLGAEESQAEYLTFNPGLIVGSTQVEFVPEPLQGKASGRDNIIAPQAVASGDLRAITLQQREQAKERMRKIVAAHLPQTDATIEFVDSYPPMAPTEGNLRLLQMYDQVSRDLGFGPVNAVSPRRAGAADISFVADHVEMAIDGLGLLGGGAHTPDEFADLRTLQIQAQRLAVLLYRLRRTQLQ